MDDGPRSPEAADDRPVTVLREMHPKPGSEAAFEAGMKALIEVALTRPGYLGASVVRPQAPGDPYRFVYKFDSLRAMDDWHRSPERARMYADVEPHVEAQRVTQLDGLATWLEPPRHGGRRKARATFVSWLAIYPSVLVVGHLVGLVGEAWPGWVRTAAVTGLVVPWVGYALGPWLAQRFRRWLAV